LALREIQKIISLLFRKIIARLHLLGVNNNMTRENKEILNNLLTEWFNNLNQIEIGSHFWSENSTGNIIKTNLRSLSHWKNKSKGRKANLIQLELARKKRVAAIETEKKKELDDKINDVKW
jgi:hypothetical protein